MAPLRASIIGIEPTIGLLSSIGTPAQNTTITMLMSFFSDELVGNDLVTHQALAALLGKEFLNGIDCRLDPATPFCAK